MPLTGLKRFTLKNYTTGFTPHQNTRKVFSSTIHIVKVKTVDNVFN